MNTSDIWKILGIEPTKDTEIIREAYLQALPLFHPEDDPTGFMELRAAYEAALAAARVEYEEGAEEGEGGADSGGPDPVRSAIRGILDDFPRRMEESEWEGLFENEGQTIDQQEALSDKLLIELMEGQFLPRRIWKLFDKVFSWSVRARQLKERFPGGYIEYVLNGMRYDRAVREEFFDFEKDGGEDFDAFIGAYHSFAEALREGELDTADELAAANTGALFAHPDYRLLVARLCRLREKLDDEKAILEELDSRWPGDPFIRTAIGNMLVTEEPEEALSVYLGVLETAPDHYGALVGAARARLEAGLFEQAKADAYELLMLDPFDGGAMSVFGAANEALVPVFTERLEKDPGDQEARYKLASCKYNLGNYEESLDLIADEEPEEAQRAKHYELYADLFVITASDMTDEDREILLEYIEAWEEAETDRHRLRFLPEKYHRLGLDDIALEKAGILRLEFPGDPEICRVEAEIYRSRGEEQNAFAAITEGLEKAPSYAALLAVEALLLDDTGNPGAAADSANASLASFPFNLEMWELLGRIYERAEHYEEVLQTIKRAEEFGLPKEVFAVRKAVALLETEDEEGEAQELLENALEKDPDNETCLEKLGMIFAKSGRTAEATELINRLIEKHESPYAYLLRGWLFANFPQVSDSFAKARARADFRKALESNDRYAPAWYQLGVLAYDEGRMKEAAADFQLTIDIDPGFSHVYFYLALAYNRIGEIQSALRVLDEGMAYAKADENEENYKPLLLKKADLLFEHHMYKEFAELGEEPIEAETDRELAAERRGDLAYALYENFEDEKAEAMFRRVFEGFGLSEAEKAPQMGSLKADYAEFLRYAKGDLPAAIEFYKSANEEHKTKRSAIRLAKAYKAAGETKEAEKLFKRALKIKEKSDSGAQGACRDYLTGECYFGLGQYRKAREFLERAVAQAKDDGDCPTRCCFEALFTLALISLEEGDRAEAQKLYKQVTETVQDRDYLDSAPLFE